MAKTALYDWHIAKGAKMVDFAGYDMPVQYQAGIMKEHLHTREAAGLFDVSHMGQVSLQAPAAELETLFPADLEGAALGQQRYSFLLNENAGIIDDVMITRRAQDFYAVFNASRKDADMAVVRAALGEGAAQFLPGRALLALQGPQAAAVLADLQPETAELAFMRGAEIIFDGVPCWVSRSGYTGEDGFEISLPADFAPAFADRLVQDSRVLPCGLGARDSLRLEAGLCLYGNDIDENTTPIEAGLAWAIGKARRPGGERAGGYTGSGVIARQLAEGAGKQRIGLLPEGRLPVRAHSPILADGETVGEITSGGFAPSLNAPAAMGMVRADAVDKALYTEVRGKRVALVQTALPFVQKRYQG